MKKTLYLLAFVALASACGPTRVVVQNPPPPPPPPPPTSQVSNEVSYQTFYDDLSPYGQWVDYPGYGYVWQPDVGYGFKPYATNGHWVYSDAGWVWASDYSWGWATFHYGRWFYDNMYGWMWVPGYEWAPAWVSWRRNDDYYGWAPLNPSVTVGANVSSYNPPTNYWCFVPHQYVTSPTVTNYYVTETKNVTIINNTTVINNNVTVNNVTNNTTVNNVTNNTTVNNRTTVNNNIRNVYAPGPDPVEVSRATGTPLRPVALTSASKPGQQSNNGQLALFRPKVNPAPASGSSNTQRPAPAKIQTLNNIKPIANQPNANSSEPARNNDKPANLPENNPANKPVSRPDVQQNNVPGNGAQPNNQPNPEQTKNNANVQPSDGTGKPVVTKPPASKPPAPVTNNADKNTGSGQGSSPANGNKPAQQVQQPKASGQQPKPANKNTKPKKKDNNKDNKDSSNKDNKNQG